MLLLLSLVFSLLRFSSAGSEVLDAYKTLEAHGLPSGLFPKGVTNFTLSDDGFFLATLNKSCTATVQNSVKYNVTITGSLTYGRMGSMTGVSAQELFLWFPVIEIRVDVPSSGVIYFDVGVVNKQFALSLFDSPPDCVLDSGELDTIEDSQIYRKFSQSIKDKLVEKPDQESGQKAIL